MKYCLSALFTVVVLIWLFGNMLYGFQPAWIAYLIVFITAITGLFLALFQRKFSNIKRPIFLPVFSIFLLFYSVVNILYISRVITQAKNIAQDKPYCIQVSSDNEYVLADTVLALSPLTMKGNVWHGDFMQLHAIMVVENENGNKLYNWSYWQGKFMELPSAEHRLIYCQPQKEFLEKLPVVFPDKPSSAKFIAHGGNKYKIPENYYPQSSTYYEKISFTAMPPDFKPLSISLNNLSFWDKINYRIDVEFKEHTDGFISHEEEYIKTDYTHNNKGELTAKIECSDNICNHVFLEDGKTYFFSYPSTLFDQRKELQGNLVKLVESFQIDAKQP